MKIEESLEVIALCAAVAVFSKIGGSQVDERISELTGLPTPADNRKDWQRRHAEREAKKTDLRTADQEGRAA